MNSDNQEKNGSSDLPVGPPVVNWQPASEPDRSAITGKFCRLEALQAHHAASLFSAYNKSETPNDWLYLPYGPFETETEFRQWIKEITKNSDPFFYAVLDAHSGSSLGVASYLRISPTIGSIEVGHIHFSPQLQRHPAATEAMFLMMQQAFNWGYRRYEWKCDALNARSRQAALRLGFEFEGIFRQATIYKGRNRDTAWYSVIDKQWPQLQSGFRQWLDSSNFDAKGNQRLSLLECRVSQS